MPATREKIREGMARAAKFGRVPGRRGHRISDEAIREVMHLGTAEAIRALKSKRLKISKAWFIERRRRLENQDGK